MKLFILLDNTTTGGKKIGRCSLGNNNNGGATASPLWLGLFGSPYGATPPSPHAIVVAS